jgi:hypothetical protein
VTYVHLRGKIMFCSKCGKKLEVGSSFCNGCGVATTGSSGKSINVSATTSDVTVREELKKFNSLTNDEIICLECGYNGLMGISNQKVVKFGFIKGLFGSLAVFIFTYVSTTLLNPIAPIRYFTWGGCIFFILAIWANVGRKYLVCPACQSLLTRK